MPEANGRECNGERENKQWKSIAVEMKTWICLRESTRISKDEKAAEVLIEVMSMHNARMCPRRSCTCVSEAIIANKTGCKECKNSSP